MAKKLYDKNNLSDEKGRLFYFDNAKFILIFFVVLAHALSPLQSKSTFCSVVWPVINYFHMPTLIFVSGFFAKRYISKTREIKVQRVATYIILYLAAQITVTAFEKLVLRSSFDFSLMAARSSLWFLQCLIAWYILLPIVSYFKPAVVMPIAIVFGLYVGYELGAANFLSLSRVFVHFPFFLAGYYSTQSMIEELFKVRYKILAVLVFASVILICLFKPDMAISKIITCNYPYATVSLLSDMPVPLKWLSRLYFYVVATALGISFLALVPRGKAFFTSLGSKTLSVYILHRYLYLAYLQYAWYLPFASGRGVALMSLIALVLTILFSLKPFTIPFDLLQKIKVTKLMKSE